MFTDRIEAGESLARRLARYKNDPNVIVLALPRGGVEVADKIAFFLNAPIDLLITRKIGHPYQPEYALGAISEYGARVFEDHDDQIESDWLEKEIKKEQKEIERRRKTYLGKRQRIDVKDKVVILVDDGVATGMTLMAALKDLKTKSPKEIIVAVPVISKKTLNQCKKHADKIISLITPKEEDFLGAVGAYFQHFGQVEDATVTKILKRHRK